MPKREAIHEKVRGGERISREEGVSSFVTPT